MKLYTSNEFYLKKQMTDFCLKIASLHKNHYKNEIFTRTNVQKICSGL